MKFHEPEVIMWAKVKDLCEYRLTKRIEAAKAEARIEAEFHAEQQRRWAEYKRTWLKPRLTLVQTEICIAGTKKPGASQK